MREIDKNQGINAMQTTVFEVLRITKGSLNSWSLIYLKVCCQSILNNYS